jgi:ABC-type nickel/cobalt efflux system permease component RcnA
VKRVVLVALLGVLALPAVAGAHPLGNFSVNHLSEVSVSADRVDVRYILDQAEIPTFQERDLGDAAVLARKRAEIAKRLVVTVDGRRVALRPAGRAVLTHPAGQGGLRTTRLELRLSAAVRGARHVEVDDGTYPGRVGWKAVVAKPGTGTAVRSSAPGQDPTMGLRHYPADLLRSPADLRVASLSVAPGDGTLSAPGFRSSGHEDAGRSDALTRAFGDAAAGKGILILLLVTAFGWGALHALSPGHGKAMVAAYLVGTRGTPRHAVLLGATVTVTHTIGVFALGLVALLLSNYVVPEDLYPWLNLVSGLLVVGVGAAVLRSRVRHSRAPAHGHHHHHSHSHGGHSHSHAPPERLDTRGLLALGASAGLIPCPSALVVLLGAIAQGQIALGILLIVAFSLGLAATLVGLGLAVVLAAKAVTRLPVPGRLMAALPTVSALAIVVVGCVLTLHAVPQVT